MLAKKPRGPLRNKAASQKSQLSGALRFGNARTADCSLILLARSASPSIPLLRRMVSRAGSYDAQIAMVVRAD